MSNMIPRELAPTLLFSLLPACAHVHDQNVASEKNFEIPDSPSLALVESPRVEVSTVLLKPTHAFLAAVKECLEDPVTISQIGDSKETYVLDLENQKAIYYWENYVTLQGIEGAEQKGCVVNAWNASQDTEIRESDLSDSSATLYFYADPLGATENAPTGKKYEALMTEIEEKYPSPEDYPLDATDMNEDSLPHTYLTTGPVEDGGGIRFARTEKGHHTWSVRTQIILNRNDVEDLKLLGVTVTRNFFPNVQDTPPRSVEKKERVEVYVKTTLSTNEGIALLGEGNFLNQEEIGGDGITVEAIVCGNGHYVIQTFVDYPASVSTASPQGDLPAPSLEWTDQFKRPVELDLTNRWLITTRPNSERWSQATNGPYDKADVQKFCSGVL